MFRTLVKGRIVLLGVCVLSCLTVFAGAQEATVKLKDGSILKGTILSRGDRFIQIRGATIGNVWINADEIVTIQEAAASAPAGASTTATVPATTYVPEAAPSSAPSSEEFQRYQEKIMKNPQTMASIQSLAANKDIQEIVSDPALRDAIMRNDLGYLQNNPKFQKFMGNPDVQKIIGNVTADDQGAQNAR